MILRFFFAKQKKSLSLHSILSKTTMSLFKTITKIERIHQLIRLEATGTPDIFAGKLNIQKRQLYNILDEFRGQGADIRYNAVRMTYFYGNHFDVVFKIVVSD